MLMKISRNKRRSILKSSNVKYKFKCPLSYVLMAEYIGMIQNCLLRRLSLYIQKETIKKILRMNISAKPTLNYWQNYKYINN